MLRTLGFLTGVGIAIAGLMVVLEPAELQRLQAETTSRLAKVLPQKTDSSKWWEQWRAEAPAVRGNAQPQTRPPAPTRIQSTASDSANRPLEPSRPDDAAESPQSPDGQPPAVTALETSEDRRRTTASLQPRSHLFWNPFRSEPAARGFADRLSTATDVPVLVTAEGPASYRVGFNYRSEAERRALIERIETVTGLELE